LARQSAHEKRSRGERRQSKFSNSVHLFLVFLGVFCALID
jgi:hypothetical protein